MKYSAGPLELPESFIAALEGEAAWIVNMILKRKIQILDQADTQRMVGKSPPTSSNQKRIEGIGKNLHKNVLQKRYIEAGIADGVNEADRLIEEFKKKH